MRAFVSRASARPREGPKPPGRRKGSASWCRPARSSAAPVLAQWVHIRTNNHGRSSPVNGGVGYKGSTCPHMQELPRRASQ